MLLVIVILLLALAGGFLGTLLEAAFGVVLVMAVVGALLAFAAYRWIGSMLGR